MRLNIPNIDAFLMFSESEHSADMYYATKFLAVDPFIYFNNSKIDPYDKLIVSDMELSRAKKESIINNVIPNSNYGFIDKIRKLKDIDAAYCELLTEFLNSENVNVVAVPYNFSVQLADCLRKNFKILPIKSPFREQRKIKTENEINAIEKAQRAGELALSEGITEIKKATSRDGILYKKDDDDDDHSNSPLTSEDIKYIIENNLLSQGCDAPDIIVACGKGTSDPHWEGAGELLTGEPIVIDMTPFSKKERYYSDMTRTVVHGEPINDELEDMYSAVLDSQIEAIKKIKAGVNGSDIHNIVCDILEERGYVTSRSKIGTTEGFIHSTGHSVGLDIHEEPTLSEDGKELKAGCVVTVEPGLYYKKIGGIRLEDVVVVTHEGCKNLTAFNKNLMIK